MEKTTIIYNRMLGEFKSQAALLITENLPGHFKVLRALLNRFLKEEYLQLKNSYVLMITGLLSEEQFKCIFSCIKSAFSLKELKRRGVPSEKIKELALLILSLLKDTMIRMCRTWKEDKDQGDAGVNQSIKTLKKNRNETAIN